MVGQFKKKSGIRETKNLSTNVDISTYTKKIQLVRQIYQKKTFFCGNLTPFLAKVFKSETTSFYYFSPRILNLKKVWTFDLGKWGQKDV